MADVAGAGGPVVKKQPERDSGQLLMLPRPVAQQ